MSAPRKQAPAWRRLAEQLKDEGCDSIYLDRLRSTHDVKGHVDRLEEELAEEMARSLGNTNAKVAYHFAKLDQINKDTEDGRRAFNEQRELCRAARHELIVHRQALGFKTNNYRAVEKEYPLPPKM